MRIRHLTTTPDGERAAYLALAAVPGIGPARLHALQRTFDSFHGALGAPFALLCTVPGLSRAGATAVAASDIDAGWQLLQQTTSLGGRVLLPWDAEFPAALRDIDMPPTVLFALGRFDLLAAPAVAIVGSRDHSAYGAAAARMVASIAAAAGLVVVSGMARGLDAVAHRAALDAGGGTIGMLGNGLGVVYPAANAKLYEQVGRDGLLLTEFPSGERPREASFPRRNRLISGLARATLVIEAAAGSGTLVTVAAALEQGRDVLAVPGPITSPTSVGTNRLIRDGAIPYLEPDDLLGLYPEARRTPGASTSVVRHAVTPLPPAATALTAALAALCLERPRHIDELVAESGRPVPEVLAEVGMLEIVGAVRQVAAGVFERS